MASALILLAVAIVALFSVGVSAQQSASQNDINTLNYALTLEQLENAYYLRGLAFFNQSAFAAAGFNSTVYNNIQMISAHETAHVLLLTTVINGLAPGTAAVACTPYNFNFTTVQAFLALAGVFENTGQTAYDGAINFISTTAFIQVAATIATIEARHAAYLNTLNGVSPFPVPFDPTNTPATVVAAVSPFLPTVCPQPQLAAIPTVKPSGVALNANGVGTNKTGSSGGFYTTTQAANDIAVLNYALILERFELAFYNYVLSNFSATQFNSTVYGYLQAIQGHEFIHVATLATVIPQRGGTVYPNCTTNFTSITTPTSVIATAALLENTGVSAYDGAVNTITDTNLAVIAATIATVEARHAAILNIVLNATASPYPTVNNTGLDTAIAPANVLSTVLSLGLVSCTGFTPVIPQVLAAVGVAGDPAFTGFHNQHFQVHGIPDKIFNIISTPSLQVNSRFKMIEEGQSMTAGQMKQARLLQQIKKGSAQASLPITTAFSHKGTFLSEMGMKLAEHKVYLLAGGYVSGLATVTLDGKDVPVSATPIRLSAELAITRPNAHTLIVDSADLSFSIVNSDGFVNIEQAQLNVEESADLMMDGLLGQTADHKWAVMNTAEFKKHMIYDFLVSDSDLFSDDFVANVYKSTTTTTTA